jgi:hypothetical protein
VLLNGSGMTKILAGALIGARYIALPLATEFAAEVLLIDSWIVLAGTGVFSLVFVALSKIIMEIYT